MGLPNMIIVSNKAVVGRIPTFILFPLDTQSNSMFYQSFSWCQSDIIVKVSSRARPVAAKSKTCVNWNANHCLFKVVFLITFHGENYLYFKRLILPENETHLTD